MSRLSICRCSLVLLAAVMAASLQLLAADPVPPKPTGINDQIFNDRPSFLVGAQVNRANREYREGDSLTVNVTSEEDAYLYVLYQQADGQVFQVFPNQIQTDNRVKARQAVRVPAETDLFRWVVGKPFGKEIIKVLATKEPVDVLSQPELLKGRFNPVSKQALKGVELELGADKPIRWGETDVEIHTYANTQPPEAAVARRYGVFFGVSQHRYNKYVVAAKGKDASNDLFAAHRDAQELAETMRTAGRLDGIKLYTNDQATKANMQTAITQWLPSVSKPGDTVVIYFSGHTGQMPDTSGDESDGKDEYLVPHDMLGPREFIAMAELHKANKLSAEDAREFEQLRTEVQNLGPEPEVKLIAATGVTDDQMARWVQRLDGRQVIFISDSCHSGGFAQDETNFKGLPEETKFDFLQGEAGRLKNLGQSDHAVLCAAHANELALERPTKDMSVLTYCLVDFLNRPTGAQRLEDCFKFCDGEMQQYFADWNKALEAAGRTERVTASHPFLLNHCTKPVFIKP
ncbi:Caspase domain protein [Anatilimnocola aggregata]|uniref:Caspase domain protein n=1 Tax=Anatilimnocola aggregata TaxID=2528021 RepID=A0A517Y4B5_9BACT|nr:DUF4384 domain-containing protein [Anatilimnocola aggregata]QDU25099.1 Caspase domain protein [Anatilimnocola aggregata]